MVWRNRCLATAELLLAGLIGAPACVQAQTIGTDDDIVRIVVPPSQELDSTAAAELVRIVTDNWAVPGLPANILTTPIALRLSLDMAPNTHGIAYPERREFHLPMAAMNWRIEDQERLIRHELAHIALATFVEFARLPVWFAEGFAMWAAGGPTCKDELRIRFDLVTRVRRQKPQPGLYGLAGDTPAALANEYYGLFFTYLEERGDKVVSDGSLLNSVKSRGIRAGLSETLGVDLAALEADWQRYLSDRFGNVPVGFSCGNPT